MHDLQVLVTGANGFVGQALVKRLASAGVVVKACVRRPLPKTVMREQVEMVPIPHIGRDTDWAPFLHNVSHVVHLAAKAYSPGRYTSDRRQEYQEINYWGTETLLAACRKQNVRRFVFISSVKVLGEGQEHAYREVDPAAPQDPYARSKWYAEEAIRTHPDAGATEWVILRPPLVYGPGVKANFLALLRLVDTNLPMPLGALLNRRSMIYLGNLVDAIVRALDHPKAAGQVFLVSDGEDLSVTEHIRQIAHALGHRPILLPLPALWLNRMAKLGGHTASIQRLTQPLTVDITKIKSELGWRPPYAVSEGIVDTVAWFRQSF